MTESGLLGFDGRVVVVTGGGAGLGRAHCIDFSARGAHVVVVDIDEAAARATCQAITDAGGRATAAVVEADDGTSTANAITNSIATLGRLDAIVNNAGVAHNALLAEDDPADVEHLLDVHFRTPYRAVRAGWKALIETRGRIVNIVSNAALFGKADMASYAASKGALLGWTRSIALEAHGHGVGVNAVAPIAATRLTAGLLGDLEERFAPETVTPVVVWLAHPTCREQGQVISIAGGAIARIEHTRLSAGVATRAEDVRDALTTSSPDAPRTTPTSAADEVAAVRADLHRAGVHLPPGA